MQNDPVVGKASELLRLGAMPTPDELRSGKVYDQCLLSANRGPDYISELVGYRYLQQGVGIYSRGMIWRIMRKCNFAANVTSWNESPGGQSCIITHLACVIQTFLPVVKIFHAVHYVIII